MWYDVHFQKGQPGTSRKASTREVEAVQVFVESGKEEDIKKAATEVMHKMGKKGFRMYHYRQRENPPYFIGETIELPGKKPFRVWNENGKVKQSGWIALPAVLFDGTPDEATTFIAAMKFTQQLTK